LCVKLVIYKDRTRMHDQQTIRKVKLCLHFIFLLTTDENTKMYHHTEVTHSPPCWTLLGIQFLCLNL